MLSRRNNSSTWEVFITAYSAYSHPLAQAYMANDAPISGWWISDRRDQALSRISAEPDIAKQAEIVKDLQRAQWDEIPVIKTGEGFSLYGSTGRLKGYGGQLDYRFWNVWNE